jgi:uncharacterized Zn-finger protein
MTENTPQNNRACTQHIYHVTRQDLPLSCPLPQFRLWDAHPRVYLPIEATGHEICPYCSAEYVLTDFQTPESK